jgi:hypothetical protein
MTRETGQIRAEESRRDMLTREANATNTGARHDDTSGKCTPALEPVGDDSKDGQEHDAETNAACHSLSEEDLPVRFAQAGHEYSENVLETAGGCADGTGHTRRYR